MQPHSTTATAYSYIRFSTPEQAKGDSLRRQTEAAEKWCERHGIHLDTSLSMTDLGKSAYTGEHRKNADRFALAAFLKLVEGGRIPRGSFLLVENLDRLTREHVRAAVTLFLSILENGVNIVTTAPERVFRHDSDDMTDVIIAVVELSRGHGESARKAETVGKAWANKKETARRGDAQRPTPRMGADCRVLTRRLPAWVRERGGKLELIPDRAEVVRRIFALASSGYGYVQIVKKLTEEGVPAFGEAVVREGRARPQFSGGWTVPYVVRILNDRRAIGEYQPRGKGRQPEGPPIPGYFPAVVGEAEHLAAQGAIAARNVATARPRRASRVGKHVNIFSGLVRHARDGDTYMYADKGNRVLINSRATEGKARAWSLLAEAFERGILRCLREIDPHSILNGDHGPDDTAALAGQLAAVDAELAEAAAYMEQSGFSATIGRRVTALEAQARDLGERLAAARQKAAHPLSETWGELHTLLDVLDDAADRRDARLRLRAAVRRIVDEVWLLVVRRGHVRLAAAQVWFAGGKRRRDYLIRYTPGSKYGKRVTIANWEVRSLATGHAQGDLDLRNVQHAERLERVLEVLPLG